MVNENVNSRPNNWVSSSHSSVYDLCKFVSNLSLLLCLYNCNNNICFIGFLWLSSLAYAILWKPILHSRGFHEKGISLNSLTDWGLSLPLSQKPMKYSTFNSGLCLLSYSWKTAKSTNMAGDWILPSNSRVLHLEAYCDCLIVVSLLMKGIFGSPEEFYLISHWVQNSNKKVLL